MDTNFPRALPHGALEEIFPDVWVVTGTFQMAPLVTISRNMIVVRQGEALTLINSVRLSEEGEAELESLGEVAAVVKLGAFHDRDDPYTVHRFRAPLYALEGAKHSLGVETDVELSQDTLPLQGARLFCFEQTRYPEAVIILEQEGGVLLTCDAAQNIVDTSGMSLAARAVTRLIGLKRPAGIGKPWRKAMAPKDGGSLRPDFDRLLELDFAHLISGHGPPLMDTAREDLQKTVDAVFG